MYCSNGIIYEGDWIDDKESQGIYYFPNGSKKTLKMTSISL